MNVEQQNRSQISDDGGLAAKRHKKRKKGRARFCASCTTVLKHTYALRGTFQTGPLQDEFKRQFNRKERKDHRDQGLPFFVLFAFFAVNNSVALFWFRLRRLLPLCEHSVQV